MQGKNPVLCSTELGQAMELLSKGTLIDLVVDLVRRSRGEDSTDHEIAATVEEWAGPVLKVRGHNQAKIVARLRKIRDRREELHSEIRRIKRERFGK